MSESVATVIICTFNRCASLKVAVESVARLQTPPDLAWELLVVDNRSSDRTPQVVADFAAAASVPVRYIYEPNAGLSHARNRGIAEANGGIIVFTDDDVEVDPLWLARIHDAFSRFHCLAVGGRVVPVWPAPKPDWFQDSGPFAMAQPIVSFDLGGDARLIDTSPFGANMAFRREAFDRVGLFRTDLGRTGNVLAGGEDIEFFHRLADHHLATAYAPDAVVFHPVTPDRMERRYFERWYFNAARSQVRLDGISPGIPCYGGVPRYLFRAIVSSLFNWLLAGDVKRRFYYWLQTCITAGRLVESWKHRNQPRPSLSPQS